MTYIRKVYKIDRSYIILVEDAPIPAKGQAFYGHRTAKQALDAARSEAEDAGAQGTDVCITPNEHASRELITACGLTVQG